MSVRVRRADRHLLFYKMIWNNGKQKHCISKREGKNDCVSDANNNYSINKYDTHTLWFCTFSFELLKNTIIHSRPKPESQKIRYRIIGLFSNNVQGNYWDDRKTLQITTRIPTATRYDFPSGTEPYVKSSDRRSYTKKKKNVYDNENRNKTKCNNAFTFTENTYKRQSTENQRNNFCNTSNTRRFIKKKNNSYKSEGSLLCEIILGRVRTIFVVLSYRYDFIRCTP